MDTSISVIIPTYNSKNTISECIYSVLNQSYLPSEIIVIDDCSKDETLEILCGIKKHSLVKIHTIRLLENGGPARARNIGLNAATGKWIAFLDSDDTWHPDKLNIQINVARQTGCQVVSTKFCFDFKFDSNLNNEVINNNSVINNVCYVSFKRMLFSNKLITPTVLISSSFVQQFNENLRYGEDYELWLRLFRDGARCALINLPLVRLGKPAYGYSGLSANLIKMEMGELEALKLNISIFPILGRIAIFVSLIKFVKRLAVVSFFKITRLWL